MKLGMNHPMGPLTLADFIGLDVCLAILNVLHEGLGDPKYRPCPLLRRMVAAGQLGRKVGTRLLHLRLTPRRSGGDRAQTCQPRISRADRLEVDERSRTREQQVPALGRPRNMSQPEM